MFMMVRVLGGFRSFRALGLKLRAFLRGSALLLLHQSGSSSLPDLGKLTWSARIPPACEQQQIQEFRV